MAKVFVTGKVILKSTFSQLADKVDKVKVRSRGPNHIGQLRSEKVVRLGKIEPDVLNKRLSIAQSVLETGKVPKSVKAAPAKVTDATLAKAKGDLTKANKKLEAERKKVAELEKEVKELKEKMPSSDPVKK